MGCVPAAFPIGFVSAALAASHGIVARGKKRGSDRLSAGKSSDQVPIDPEVIQHEAWRGVFVVFCNRRLRFVLASAEIQALG